MLIEIESQGLDALRRCAIGLVSYLTTINSEVGTLNRSP